jgi:hypothetical protein
LVTNNETQITSDGKKNSIINGITDWVYEEEFAFVKAFDFKRFDRIDQVETQIAEASQYNVPFLVLINKSDLMIDELKSYHGLDNSFEEQLISDLRSETRKRSIIKIWKSKN